MWTIRNTKTRLWVFEYPTEHNLAKLKWTWTLEWLNATRYDSEELAKKRAGELGVEDWKIEEDKRK